MSSSLDERYRACLAKRPNSLVRIVNILKKDMDWRLTEKLQERGYTDFKLGDMVLIVNISPEGTINNELAKKARISKQAMSKVVKNLEAAGYIITRKHDTDNRATVITLSDKGKALTIAASEAVDEVQAVYREITGEENFLLVRDILKDLITTLYPDI